MIENIRKYTGVMIVVLVLLFVGLVFLENSASSALSGKSPMTIDGTGISVNEYRRLGANPLRIPESIGFAPITEKGQEIAKRYVGDAAPTNRAQLLQVMNYSLGADPANFLANRYAVQKAGLKYGATPGKAEIEDFIRNVLFSTPDGNFDQQGYNNFLTDKLGTLGLDSKGFNDYLRDLLTAQNLSKIVGGALAPDPATARFLTLAEGQAISGQKIELSRANYLPEAEPTDEELRAFYDENQDRYNSTERRKVRYVHVQPDWDAKLKEVQDAEAKAKADAEKAAAEAKEKADKEAAEAKAKAEKEAAEAAAKAATEAPAAPAEQTPAQPAAPAQPVVPASPATPTEEPAAQGDPGEPGETAPEPAAPAEPVAPATPAASAAPATPEVVVPPAAPAANTTAEPITPAPTETATTPAVSIDPVVTPTSVAVPVTPTEPAKPAEPKPAKEQLTAAQRSEAVKAMTTKVDDQWTQIYNAIVKGDDFNKAVETLGYKVESTDAFEKDKAPELFQKRVLNSRIGTMAEAIFKMPANGVNDERLANVYQVDDGYFLAYLDEVTDSQPLTFEEAKDQVLADYRQSKAAENLEKKATEFQEQLAAAAKEKGLEGFKAKAKELDLTVTPVLNASKPQIPLQFQLQGYSFPPPPEFIAAKATDPGQVSEPHLVNEAPEEQGGKEGPTEKAYIVYVEKREFEETPQLTADIDRAQQRQQDELRLSAFQAWLEQQFQLNNVQVQKEAGQS